MLSDDARLPQKIFFDFFVLHRLFPLALFHLRAIVSGMQDDKKLPDDLGTAHDVILVQSNTLVKQKVKIEELNTSLQEALAEIRFLRSGKKREKFINADQLLLEFPEDKELQASLEAAKKEAVREYREQERRDKADTAVLQAARRRVRAELRKGK